MIYKIYMYIYLRIKETYVLNDNSQVLRDIW